MEHLAVFGAVLAFVSLSHTSAQHSSGTAVVDDGRIGVGLITGGNFGPHSFSIGNSPGGRPKTQLSVNEDKEDVQYMDIGQQDNYQPSRGVSEEPSHSGGFNSGNTQLYPVKSLTNTNPEKGDNEGEMGSAGGQILIGAVVQNSNEHIKDSKKRNGNKQPAALDAAAIESIFGTNSGKTGFPSTEKGSSNTGQHGSIQVDAITGGKFEDGYLNINNNRKPGTNVLLKGSGVNNENTGNTNTGNEAQGSKDHNAKNNGAGNAREDLNHGQMKSGYNSDGNNERWIWNR